MSRSVELGRAVLDVPTMNHELWLTTLITILPEQNATYLAQLTTVKCLEFLSSGVPWVHRGHGMHMDLRLALHSEALPGAQLQDVANAVLRAPMWNQLMLSPSLPASDITNSGTVRFDIGHAAISGSKTEQKRHRLFSNVPASDVRPPDSVVSVALQSIHLSIDIVETSSQRRLLVKRSNPTPSRQETSKPEAKDNVTNLFDPDLTEGSPHCDTSKLTVLASNRKRKRPVMGMSPDHLQTSDRALSQPDIRTMVENALRISIRGTISKTHNGCKIKASTFRSGLADIAPALWRGGYLDAISHRAQLMPTITQSLVQTGLAKAMSKSLRSKMESINHVMHMNQKDKYHEPGNEDHTCIARTRSSTAAQLWSHSQRILLCDSIPPIQACVASDLEEVNLDSDDMLAEEDIDRVGDVCGINKDDNLLNNSSETISDYTLPATSSITTGENHPDQVYQQISGDVTLVTGLSEFDEELLFDSPLKDVT